MEEWRDVVGFEGIYEISSFGVLRNKLTGLIKKVNIDSRKVTTVKLQKDKKAYTFAPHRIVMEAFVGPRPEGMECCHYDGDRLNNRLDNLRWDTPKNNHKDTVRHGRFYQGHNNKQAKLTKEQADAIKNDPRVQRRIAEEYGVSPQTVCRIKKGRTYIHV